LTSSRAAGAQVFCDFLRFLRFDLAAAGDDDRRVDGLRMIVTAASFRAADFETDFQERI
jgi:hypothetical protein